jgi:two-component system LytT family response regulator
MNFLIIDDEPLARAELIRLFSEISPDIKGVEASSLAEARAALLTADFEGAFVDMDVAGHCGLDFLSDARTAGTPVVVVTAHERYAVDAFDRGASDYLLKPVESQRLYRAIMRIQRQKKPDSPDLLFLSDQSNCWPVNPEDVLLAEAEGSYTVVSFGERKPLTVCHTLKEIEALLAPHSFVRANRSQLVNLRRIQVLRRESTGRLAASIEGYGEVEFSRRQAKALRSRFVI